MSAASHPFRQEVRATLVLAGPVVAAMLAQNSMGFVDTVMVGRLGKEALAGVALGNMAYFFVLILCMGVVMAVGPMVSQAFGAREEDAIGRSTRQGIWLGSVLAVPAMVALYFAGDLLLLAGQNPETVAMTQGYLRAIMWGFMPALWFIALRSFAEGVSRPWPVTLIALVGVGLNVVANGVLMFGKYGFPALGLVGTGWATTIVSWFLFIALAAFMHSSRVFRRYHVFAKLGRPDAHYFRELLRIGWPIGISLGIESGLFTVTAYLMGLLGSTALAAHQIALQSAAFTFMVPLGIGIAASVRVGHAVGRKDGAGVRRAGYVGIGLGSLFMLCSAIVFWTLPEYVVALYLDLDDPANRDVVQLALSLLGIAAVFQLFDGIQVSAGGALRGLKDTRVPMVLGFISYWLIGLTTGYTLCFVMDYGAAGLWWGLVVGLGAASLALVWRFHVRSRILEAPAVAQFQ